MRSRLALLLLITLPLLQCCVSLKEFEAMRADRDLKISQREYYKRELAQAQQFIAGAHDDNAMLQKILIEQEAELRRWQMGSALQAVREAELRQSCEI